MLKKVIGFNGSPRKKWNTYQLVKRALEGAKDAGAETKFYNLIDLNIKPCTSCLTCQKGKKYSGRCTIKDDLTPILEEIKTADALIFGVPIYLSYPSSLVHTALERMLYSSFTYTPEATTFPRKTKTLFIYTMNVSQNLAKQRGYEYIFNTNENYSTRVFRGTSKSILSCDTQQVKDYSKYAITIFNAEEKYKHHKEQFPKDLENAYNCGRELVLSE